MPLLIEPTFQFAIEKTDSTRRERGNLSEVAQPVMEKVEPAPTFQSTHEVKREDLDGFMSEYLIILVCAQLRLHGVWMKR